MIEYLKQFAVYYLWFDVVKYVLLVVLLAYAFRCCDPRARTTIKHYNFPTSNESHIRFMTYNIAFGGGTDNLKGSVHSRAEIKENLNRIIDTVKLNNINVLAVQEIDLNSRRSWFRNEVSYIARQCEFPYVAIAITWNKTWVPYPTTWKVWQHYGQILAAHAVFSKFPLKNQSVLTFPKPKERSMVYRSFYMDRICQFVEVQRPSGQSVTVGNLHLEAFKKKTRINQVDILKAHLDNRYSDSPLIVAGDFNAIYPGSSQTGYFEDEPDIDYGDDPSIQKMLDVGYLKEGLADMRSSTQELLTFPSMAPNRQLDYVFYSPKYLTLEDSAVVHEAGDASDHLPLSFVFL